MPRLSLPLDRLRPTYDAIVVGSGYGGGVAASRLARSGLRVAVLERGREVETGGFPARFPELRQDLQVASRKLRTGPETALFDVRVGDDMHVLVGCGLGGGSLINAGVALVPDHRVFEDPVWPGQIRQDGTLAEGYRRAEAWLRPNADPHAARHTKVEALRAATAPMGRTLMAPRVVVSFEDTVNAAGIAQPACTRCGDCCAGCNVGAKNTVALTYLPDAARHGAEIFTTIKVRRIEPRADGHWRVHTQSTAARATLDDIRILEAPIVVLAAGTLGSTEILLRSRDAGLVLSETLGQRFSANGDIIAFGYGAANPVNAVGVGHPSKVEGLEIGAAVSAQVEFTDATNLANALTVQEGVLPSALAPILPVLFVPNGRLLGAVQSLIAGVYKGPFARLQTFFAVSHDTAAGRFTLDDDRLVLAWPNAKSEPVYRRLDTVLGEIVANAGGVYVKNPLAGTVMGHQPATAHPLGGCGMGADRAMGTVNHYGAVYDGRPAAGATDVHKGLYVIDGAIIPRSLGVNPLLTITALAERALIHLTAERGLRFEAF